MLASGNEEANLLLRIFSMHGIHPNHRYRAGAILLLQSVEENDKSIEIEDVRYRSQVVSTGCANVRRACERCVLKKRLICEIFKLNTNLSSWNVWKT